MRGTIPYGTHVRETVRRHDFGPARTGAEKYDSGYLDGAGVPYTGIVDCAGGVRTVAEYHQQLPALEKEKE